jgi:hypothetical protein
MSIQEQEKIWQEYIIQAQREEKKKRLLIAILFLLMLLAPFISSALSSVIG